MPAKIVVTNPDGAEAEHWVEDDVVRIGSDSQCDVPLSGRRSGPHTATLEYLNGSYLVYNRSNAGFTVGGHEVSPGGSSVWAGGEVLETNDGASLELRIDGNPAPARRPRAIDLDDELPEPFEVPAVEPEADPATAGSNTGLQLGVILTCVAAAAWLLLYDPGPTGADAARARGPSFARLVRELCRAEDSGDRDLSAIRGALQAARIDEARGDPRHAASIYDDVRDALLARGRIDGDCVAGAAESGPRPIDCLVWDYIKARR